MMRTTVQLLAAVVAAFVIAVLMLVPPTFVLASTHEVVECRALTQRGLNIEFGDGITAEQSEQIDAYIADVGYPDGAIGEVRQEINRGVLALCAELRQERTAWIMITVGGALAAMIVAGFSRPRGAKLAPPPDMSQSSFVELIGMDAAKMLANQRVFTWRDLSDRRRGFIARLDGIDAARLDLLDEGLRQRSLEWLR